MSNFPRALQPVLQVETGGDLVNGGYTVDQGGPTRWGISQRAYPNEDIQHLTRERAEELYFRDYWTPMHCEDLSWPVALMLFDAAVNQGTGAAPRLLQEALGVAVDGVLGPKTLAAAQGMSPAVLAWRLGRRRLRRYARTEGSAGDHESWTVRTLDMLYYGLLP